MYVRRKTRTQAPCGRAPRANELNVMLIIGPLFPVYVTVCVEKETKTSAGIQPPESLVMPKFGSEPFGSRFRVFAEPDLRRPGSSSRFSQS